MGAPLGNVNAVRHGARSKRHGVVLARLGKRYAEPYHAALQLRREVETLLGAENGTLTLMQTARIQTLCRLEMSARIAELTLRKDPDLSADAVRQLRHAINTTSRERDNLLAELLGSVPTGGKGGKPGVIRPADDWDVILNGDPAADVPPATPATSEAAADPAAGTEATESTSTPPARVENPADPTAGGDGVKRNDAFNPPKTSPIASETPKAAETPPDAADAFAGLW